MLEQKRIDEAENNVKKYLAEGLLTKTQVNTNVLEIFKNNAKESLKVAQLLFEQRQSDLWTIVCSYYSMFYIANAVLYKKGFKIGDKIPHKVTSDALIVFVKDKLKEHLITAFEELRDDALELAKNKAEGIIENYDFERIKRGRIQYSTTEIIKRQKAETSLKRAKEFHAEFLDLLNDL